MSNPNLDGLRPEDILFSTLSALIVSRQAKLHKYMEQARDLRGDSDQMQAARKIAPDSVEATEVYLQSQIEQTTSEIENLQVIRNRAEQVLAGPTDNMQDEYYSGGFKTAPQEGKGWPENGKLFGGAPETPGSFTPGGEQPDYSFADLAAQGGYGATLESVERGGSTFNGPVVWGDQYRGPVFHGPCMLEVHIHLNNWGPDNNEPSTGHTGRTTATAAKTTEAATATKTTEAAKG